MIPHGKNIYLCRPDLSIITILNGVRTDEVNLDVQTKDFDELTFVVDEYIVVDGKQVKSNGYDTLDVYLNVYLEGIGYFQIQHPKTVNDGNNEVKYITAYSLEKEWEQHNWVGLKVNTGTKDSLEQLAEDNLNELGFAKEFVQFYRPDKEDLSLVHLMLQKMPGWSVQSEDVDPELWSAQIRIEEDNISLYALATSVIAPKIECLILFDTMHRRIKAISKNSLDSYTRDTNVFIGFRNLANEVTIDVDEDSVYTRFNVQGDEGLTFLDVNYGDLYAFDYSYFLRSPYMRGGFSYLEDESDNTLTDEVYDPFIVTDGMIDKVQRWIKWRDDNRETYISLSKQIAEVNEDIYEVKYRLPDDGTDWSQWDDMTEEALNENLTYYNALITSLQISVDPDPQYDSEGNYIPWQIDGEVDHERYLDALYALGNGYGGYYTYLETITYIIPNIETAIYNLDKPDEQKHDYNLEYETNWDLYGIEELNNKKKNYENQLDTLSAFSKAWEDMTADEKAVYINDENMYNSEGRTKYLEIAGYLGDDETPGTLLYKLKELNDELDAYNEQLNALDEERNSMKDLAMISNEYWELTEAELNIMSTLNHDTDYINTNILTTSLDTTVTRIDRELELYEDAVSKLSEVSQPQFSFDVSLDNLLNIPEFTRWKDNFEILNYFRLGIRDNYSVKLRMIGYSYNPCDVTSDLKITFSSMITSRSGRSDLTALLNTGNNSGSRNAISVGTGSSDSERDYAVALLQTLMRTSAFRNEVTDIASGVAGSGEVDPATVRALTQGYISVAQIDVDQITGDIANFMEIHSQYIDADVVVANSADFGTLDADFANLMQAVIGTSSTQTGIVFNLSSANAVIDANYVSSLVANRISVADLMAHSASANEIVLISQDGSPSIAFKNSTQQFYDSDGNVRVQIGQDGNGDFNFIVRGADGTSALFNENGITQNGIPNNTIINNMISDNTIQKAKLGFSVIEPNQQGGIDITQVYDGNGNLWGVQYTSFVNSTNSNITTLSQQVAALSGTVEAVELVGTQVFIEDSGGTLSPSSITVTARVYNNMQIGKWYIDGVENTSYVAQDKLSITIPSSEIVNKSTLQVRVEGVDTSKYDVFTIYRVANGVDAYSVVINSDQGTVFKTDSGVTQCTVTCDVYHGSTIATPRSYAWYYANNNGAWTSLGLTTKTITLPLSLSVIRKRLKCVVEV